MVLVDVLTVHLEAGHDHDAIVLVPNVTRLQASQFAYAIADDLTLQRLFSARGLSDTPARPLRITGW